MTRSRRAIVFAISVAVALAAASVQPVAADRLRSILPLPSRELRQLRMLPGPALTSDGGGSTAHAVERRVRRVARATAPIDLSGRWVPSDPAKNTAYFNVGLATVSALGMTITQDRDTITIASVESAATDIRRQLSPDVRLNARYTFGTDAGWEGSTLIVTDHTPRGRSRSAYSLVDDALTVIHDFEFSTGRSTQVSLSYRREQQREAVNIDVPSIPAVPIGGLATMRTPDSDIWITLAPTNVPGGSGAVRVLESEMYVEGPSAGIGFERAAAGVREVWWFSIKAWKEAEAARVVVYARLPDKRAPSGYTETPISTFHIAPRQSVEVGEAEKWGGPRLVVSAAVR